MEQKFLNLVAEIMEEDRVTMDTRYKEGKWDSLDRKSVV